ncbi:MAG: hypothetical protein ACRDJN_16820 [Chloroflexota bacterium]
MMAEGGQRTWRMLAGVARATITPPVGSTWQGGYGARRRAAQGVHDDLCATALVLQEVDAESGSRVALITADLVSLSDDQVQRVRQLVGEQGAVAPERIMICCSHTHGGPATRKSASLPVNDTYLATLEQHLAGVVYQAARRLQPVAVGLGHGEARFNVNRRLRLPDGQTAMRPNPDGAVDRGVAVLRLDSALADDEGEARNAGAGSPDEPGRAEPAGVIGHRPLALLFRFTCHATSLGGQNYLVTADYPGAARRFVERAYGDSSDGAAAAGEKVRTMAMFLPGCFGNVRPNLTAPAGGFRSATWEELAALGRQLGSAAVQAGEAVRDPTSPQRGADLSGPVGAASARIELPLEPNDAGRQSWPAEVQVLRVGAVYLVGLPGEVFVEIGWRTQRAVAAAARVPVEHVLVQGYSNGNVGYVPTAAAIPEGGYEVGAWKNSDRPAGFTDEAERLLAETAATLAGELA